ncbi:MAG: energy-coupled thiamine transporter ThiT [Clostridiales Family XIII bacterium]|jgi:thiamine transporter|nr:energy-coupled thiamine transporter ThiT [Clostridiales Family XIII bacterium]
MKHTKLLTLIEGAVIVAVATALSWIPLNLPNASFDLSLGLIPLGVYALRRGAPAGLVAGFVWGLLLIVLGKAYFMTIPQVLLEYPIAFALGGLGGVFSGRLRGALAAKETRRIHLTVIFAGVVAACARWFIHFWAGVIFWGSYAPEGMSPYIYSGIMNGASAAANAAMLAVVLTVVVKAAPALFVPKEVYR